MGQRLSVLAGDIGGTKTALARFEVEPDVSGGDAKLYLRDERVYPSQDFASFDDIVRVFVEETGGAPKYAAFGAAGPVVDRTVQVTNLPWVVSAQGLARSFGFRDVGLLNDVEANAWGLGELGSGDVVALRAPRESRSGHRVLMSPGTGLGVAGLYWDGRRHRPFATESGHAGFAPENDEQRRLLAFASRQGPRVTWEDLIAGPGLPTLYEFVVDDQGLPPDPSVRADIDGGEGPPAITHLGLDGTSLAAAEAVRLYVQLLGSAAGNAALQYLATGGVFLGGGIVPRLADHLVDKGLLESFLSKAPMEHILEDIPVYAVMQPKAALFGAARVAATLSYEG